MAHKYNLRSTSKARTENSTSQLPQTVFPKSSHRVVKITVKKPKLNQKCVELVKVLKSCQEDVILPTKIDADPRNATVNTTESYDKVKSPASIQPRTTWVTIYNGPRNLILLRNNKNGELVFSKSRDAHCSLEFFYHGNRLVSIWERNKKTWLFCDTFYLVNKRVDSQDIDSVVQSIEHEKSA